MAPTAFLIGHCEARDAGAVGLDVVLCCTGQFGVWDRAIEGGRCAYRAGRTTTSRRSEIQDL